jgi:hypothetical protein
MNWEFQAAALNALAEIEIKMRKPGDWYVSQRLDIKQKHTMVSVCGNGLDPEYAIIDHWKQAVDDLPPDQYLVARIGDRRKAVRWNGFMWEDVIEPPRVEAA